MASVQYPIKAGSIWRNKKSGIEAMPMNTAEHSWQFLQLLRNKGKPTRKQAHYFIEDYELVQE